MRCQLVTFTSTEYDEAVITQLSLNLTVITRVWAYVVTKMAACAPGIHVKHYSSMCHQLPARYFFGRDSKRISGVTNRERPRYWERM
ncbi:hypothetical protein EVAR_41532_1 [Eumeta japonica]|uniref:Uncharacterized protein n=1 Tax=Eumeta variegata TaxID=151549 RepID=A0A4C1X4G6_EUMVA|nr:hypothetical protein EVAR_41532_1 [Eumeta japonica]